MNKENTEEVDEGIISAGRNDALKTILGFGIFITLFFILFPLIGDEIKNDVLEVFVFAVLLAFTMEHYIAPFENQMILSANEKNSEPLSVWWYLRIIIFVIFPTMFGAVILLNDKTTEYAWIVVATTVLGAMFGSFLFLVKNYAKKRPRVC